MSKAVIGFIFIFIALTTYTPQFNLNIKNYFLIKKIIIDNNEFTDKSDIKKKLNYLYSENLFFLKSGKIEKMLKKETFIESFKIKKIYPNTIKLILNEKEPIAILQDRKKKFYISNKGDLINFKKLKIFENLPVVFGNSEKFILFYKDLVNIKFPINTIKSIYYFESNRWDIVMQDNKVIKLPINNYLESLENFLIIKKTSNYNTYNIFDYRIKDQLILK